MTNQQQKFRVIAHKGSAFDVTDGQGVFVCGARGNLKQGGGIIVGDFVDVEDGVITRIYPRANSLVRPSVANIDQAVIVVATVPEADFYLIDKMIINCRKIDIDVVLCINKVDLGAEELYTKLVRQYKRDIRSIVRVSAKDNNTATLKRAIKGRLSAFCGQSAVGKSSLVNAMCKNTDRSVGELSGNNRGKNTTTRSGLIQISADTYVIDTPGFGSLDIFGVDSKQLHLYYNDFVRLADECKFRGCTHTHEPNCAVKVAVDKGRVDLDRYERYLRLIEGC